MSRCGGQEGLPWKFQGQCACRLGAPRGHLADGASPGRTHMAADVLKALSCAFLRRDTNSTRVLLVLWKLSVSSYRHTGGHLAFRPHQLQILWMLSCPCVKVVARDFVVCKPQLRLGSVQKSLLPMVCTVCISSLVNKIMYKGFNVKCHAHKTR